VNAIMPRTAIRETPIHTIFTIFLCRLFIRSDYSKYKESVNPMKNAFNYSALHALNWKEARSGNSL